MCQLLETIKVKDGKLLNIQYHNERFNRSRSTLFEINEEVKLENYIPLNPALDVGIFKCRVIYDKTIISISFQPYFLPNITSLKIVIDDTVDYSFKYENRQYINDLYLQKGSCDDIVIVKNGLVTDTSYANIVFSDGKTLFTPAKPLLYGTKRAKLIAKGLIAEAEIKISDIKHFRIAYLINAMIDIEDKIEIPTNKFI